MNCPQCDTLMYKPECPCGFKVPPISTIEIKKMGATESAFPVKIHPAVKAHLEKATHLTGKAYAEYCIDYAKRLLRGENVN